jgi:hypothetical protein
MTPGTDQVDPTRCPLCGDRNGCGAAQGAQACWCFAVSIPTQVLERVPPEQRNRACLCKSCATGDQAGAAPIHEKTVTP